jgi:glyoxylase I family protein
VGAVKTLSGFSHVALTVTDMKASRHFYAEVLGLPVLDSSEIYCALLTGSSELSALILTTHPETAPDAFSEFRAGLDHVSLAVPDDAALSSWQDRLQELAVPFDFRRSEWGHHLNFRDPDNIAVELVLLRPDAEVRAVLDRSSPET